MLKYAVLLLNTIALLIYHFFFADGITVTQKVPSSAKPGDEFTVEMTISKGSASGFAKLQMDLPEGFYATQDENNGASFTFSSQSVKFIWMSLPADQEFRIRYKVKVGSAITNGDKSISGKFSFVTDNVKQTIDVAPSIVTIGDGTPSANPVATSPANNQSSDNTAGNNLTSQLIDKSTTTSSAETSPVNCTRIIIPENPTGDFVVEVTVNKGNLGGFAKLMESLPAGFTATALESQGGSFSFADGKIKYVWMSMPTTTEFKISYKVSMTAGTSGPQVIDGVFSYIENDETKKYMMPSTTVNAGGAATQPLTATTPATTTDNTLKSTPVATTPDNTSTTTATTPADGAQPATTTAATTPATNDNATRSLSASTIPSPQGNVNYKVQVAALHTPVEADKLAVRYGISQKIEMEMADGYTKYLVGAHSEYKLARDARETIKANGVSDAFVTAYNSGKRITVQEALMITAQKWYR